MSDYQNNLFVSTLLSSSLSVIGCTMMICFYINFPEERAVSHLFCLWLGISGIGVASTSFIIVDVEDGDVLCTLFACVEDYFILCASFTTVVIAIRIKKIIFQMDGYLVISDLQFKVYCCFVWGLPLMLTLLPLATGSYGQNDDDVYCFIKYDRDNRHIENVIAKVWVVASFYGPVLLSVSAIIVIYSQCIHRLHTLQVCCLYVLKLVHAFFIC